MPTAWHKSCQSDLEGHGGGECQAGGASQSPFQLRRLLIERDRGREREGKGVVGVGKRERRGGEGGGEVRNVRGDEIKTKR